jgi:cysteine desulfurase
VAHLTDNFTSETALSPAVREAISAAFEQGWADPKKQSQASSKAAILLDGAKSEIAAHLHTTPDRLEVIGEPALLHYIALHGFITSASTLYTSTVDVGKIRAVARPLSDESKVIGVDEEGLLLTAGVKFEKNSILSLQATNGESGATQDLDRYRDMAYKVVVDGTRSLPNRDLTTGFAATTFDAASWSGPQGIGFINICDAKSFKYPLPHIAPIRVPGSFSLPLLIGSAIALNEFKNEIEKVISLRKLLVDAVGAIEGLTVLAPNSGVDSRYLSIIVEEVSSEEVLRSLLKENLAIDAGSACSPEDLTPSHVIASMGFPTTGHLRFTLHPHHTASDIERAASTLKKVLTELRS